MYDWVMIPPLSDADLRLLRVFHTIVMSGGVTAAQPELNASQSTISTQLSQLETRLGFQLCQRGRSGFKLTERGRVVFEEARILFSAVDEFRVRVTESGDELEGELRIGIIDNLIGHPGFCMAQAIAAFQQRSPKTVIDLHIGSVITLESMVLDGRLHLAISFCHHRLPSLAYREVLAERHLLYCSKAHPLFGITDAELAHRGIGEANYVTRSYLEGGLAPTGLKLHPAAQADNIEALAFMVLSGRYITFLPDYYAQRWVDSGDMRPILPRSISHSAAINLIWTKTGRLPRVADAFIKDFDTANGNMNI